MWFGCLPITRKILRWKQEIPLLPWSPASLHSILSFFTRSVLLEQ